MACMVPGNELWVRVVPYLGCIFSSVSLCRWQFIPSVMFVTFMLGKSFIESL
jgi:hypothetical protein